MGERMDEHWHNLSIDDSLVAQGSSETGILVDEVIERRKAYGLNKLDEPEKTSALLRFLSQYNDPLNYLLIGAALVALAIKPDHPGDAIFIFIVLQLVYLLSIYLYLLSYISLIYNILYPSTFV